MVRGNYVRPLVIFVIFMRFEIEEVGDALKSSFVVATQAANGGNFDGKGGFPLCNTAVSKLYCKPYWAL